VLTPVSIRYHAEPMSCVVKSSFSSWILQALKREHLLVLSKMPLGTQAVMNTVASAIHGEFSEKLVLAHRTQRSLPKSCSLSPDD
jgi:hypothetical protein